MTETERVAAALAEGRAVLRYIVINEAWYSDVAKRDGAAAELSIGVDAITADGYEDGTFGEGSIRWYDLRQTHLSAKLELFHDAWAALAAVPGFWDTLAMLGGMTSPSMAEVRTALESIGFVDCTPRESPYASRS